MAQSDPVTFPECSSPPKVNEIGFDHTDTGKARRDSLPTSTAEAASAISNDSTLKMRDSTGTY